MPGFRKGKVPPRIIDQRVGRGTVLQEAVNEALPRFYARAVEESAKGQKSVAAGFPLFLLVVLTVLMIQLQSVSRVAMVVLTAPLGLIGVTARSGALIGMIGPWAERL